MSPGSFYSSIDDAFLSLLDMKNSCLRYTIILFDKIPKRSLIYHIKNAGVGSWMVGCSELVWVGGSLCCVAVWGPFSRWGQFVQLIQSSPVVSSSKQRGCWAPILPTASTRLLAVEACGMKSKSCLNEIQPTHGYLCCGPGLKTGMMLS